MNEEEKAKLWKLVARWHKDADQYAKQVEEARAAGTPYEQMLAAKTFLRQCGKDLEAVVHEITAPKEQPKPEKSAEG